MSTLDPQRSPSATDDGPGAPPPEKRRNVWIWISAVLALAAVGLLIWGLTTQSDLDSSKDDVSDLETQVSSESAESEAAKDVAGELAEDLGSTNEDLATTEQKLDEAEQSATKAEKDAAAAKKDADEAQNATDKAQAEAKEAQAEADAAESKTAIAGDCARAYVTAFGTLFEGESVKSQAEDVRKDLQSISAQCQSALAGE